MPENEFEKQVQQKMDGLKFDPSAEVWENVAAAITKRKKDRRVFVILFLCLLLISGAIFILLNYAPGRKSNRDISYANKPGKINSTTEQTNNTSKFVDATNAEKPVKEDSIVNREVVRIDNEVMKKTEKESKLSALVLAENKNSSVNDYKLINNNLVSATNEVQNITSKQQYKTSQKLSASVSNRNAVDLVNEKVASGDRSKPIPEDNSTVINDLVVKVQVTDTLTKDSSDRIKQANDTVAVILSNGNKKDTVTKKTIQSKQKNKWELGFNFSFGATATQKGYLGIGSGNNNESYSYAFSQSTGSNSVQINNVYASSAIKPGTGIVVGLFVQKSISPKTEILFGLNYRMYSSVIITDTRVDTYNGTSNNSTNLSFGSRSSNSGRYKNNFHFIELPVAVHFKLSKQNKLPIYLNTGISIAQLISSNALQFDTSSGRYVNNNSLLNKTQFNLSAGLLFSLSRQAKNPFLIGPDLSFSVNKMANSGLYKNGHYSYLGITIQKTIGKK